MENTSAGNLDPDSVLSLAAEKVLSNALGSEVHFTSLTRLTDPDRHIAIYRCLAAPGSQRAATYIVKQIGGDANSTQERKERRVRAFTTDWVGAEFLSSIPSHFPISPRFYGSDPKLGFFVMEDLGEHRSLVGPLLEGDALSAEEALLKYSTCLGRLHAMTAGKFEIYQALMASRFSGPSSDESMLEEFARRMKTLPGTLEPFGVASSSAIDSEIQIVMESVTQPGPFLAYTHADPCPDNVFDLGERFCLIDFEYSHFGHALRDAIYPRMVWPSCWCANRLPAQTIARMENRYRAELAEGCPQAVEDAVWENALAQQCGAALLFTLAFELEEASTENHEWGLATMRQRVLARLDAFMTAAEEFHKLPALRGVASQLLPVLQARWTDTPALQLYPAFRSAP